MDYISNIIDHLVSKQDIKINEYNAGIINNIDDITEDVENSMIKTLYIEMDTCSWHKILNALYFFPKVENLFILVNTISGSTKTFTSIINNFQFKTLLIKQYENISDNFLVRWNGYISSKCLHVFVGNSDIKLSNIVVIGIKNE